MRIRTGKELLLATRPYAVDSTIKSWWHVISTAFLLVAALTGVLFVVHAVRLLARLALAYRRPTQLSLTNDGVRVKTRTLMLLRIRRILTADQRVKLDAFHKERERGDHKNHDNR